MDKRKWFSFIGDKRFLGSSLAILVGVGALGSGYITLGWSMILGALAYRSAKKRHLELVRTTFLRKLGEWVAILLIVLGLFFTSRNDFIADPFSNIVLPLWALIAYGIVALVRPRATIENASNP